jgi:hypothetical protein
MIDRHSLADALEFRLALCQAESSSGLWKRMLRTAGETVNVTVM